MNQIFTQEDIVHFIYQGVPSPIREEVKSRYKNDPDFHETCEEFIAVKEALDEIKYIPSQTAIDTILEYSRKNLH